MRAEYKLQEPQFTVENIEILNVFRPKGFNHFYRNGRTKHGFIYTVKGITRYSFSNVDVKDLSVKAGEFIFIPKGVVYSTTYIEDGTETKIVQFDLKTGILPLYLNLPQKIFFPDAGEQINSFFQPIKNHFLGHPFYYRSRLYELLWKIDETYNKIPTKYKRLQTALSEISENYHKNEKVSYYASLCDMSEVGFRRLFKEYTGQSPIEYRNNMRLANARIKLQSGEFNISEVVEFSGFSNLSFFIRLYKKKYGRTPKKE